LSFEAVDFLQGSDADEIRKSAEALKGLVGQKTAPLANVEPESANAKEAALRSLSQSLKKE
jgi:hypothetical protein